MADERERELEEVSDGGNSTKMSLFLFDEERRNSTDLCVIDSSEERPPLLGD
jgi:hypothetical protein